MRWLLVFVFAVALGSGTPVAEPALVDAARTGQGHREMPSGIAREVLAIDRTRGRVSIDEIVCKPVLRVAP